MGGHGAKKAPREFEHVRVAPKTSARPMVDESIRNLKVKKVAPGAVYWLSRQLNFISI